MTTVEGTVVKGKGKGANLGFPTVNIPLKQEIESGVYRGKVFVPQENKDNLGYSKEYKGAIFIGREADFLEVYILDFEGDLYNRKIRVEVKEKIREVGDFKSRAGLKEQIAKDIKVINSFYNDMFTGIIKRVSTVEKASYEDNGFFVSIKIPRGWKIEEGESIAVNGVCSTVKDLDEKTFTVEYMPESVKKTTVGNFEKGTEINLEKSLKVNDLLDGHIVQGHVDTRGKIINIKKEEESKLMKIQVPEEFMKYIASKGSIAVDGISLTVVDVGKNWFSTSLVSYTLENTNLGNIREGSEVNIETDILAKYVARLLDYSS